MTYIIARKNLPNAECIAVEAESSGKTLASLVSYLGLKTLDKNIEILTVSCLETFSEYRVTNHIHTEKEFISEVLDMYNN